MLRPLGIYVHIPYCSRKCPYCDFTTFAVPRVPQERYIAAIKAELRSYSQKEEFLGRKVRTIFFGGGTPSLIDPRWIAEVISSCMTEFPQSDVLEEVTLEANPGAVSLCRLQDYLKAGVSRISFGAQSLNQKHLTMLGRTHSRTDVQAAIGSAREAGFKMVSADLLFGVPNQTVSEVDEDISEFLKLGVNHLSTYGLTYEKGTPYFQSVARGVLKPLSDDVTADMYELIIDRLTKEGFEQYEVSNFAQEGAASKHNLMYWNCGDYLGLGVGAHSYRGLFDGERRLGGIRWANGAEPAAYMENAQNGLPVVSWSEHLSAEQSQFEHLFVGLRRMKGVAFQLFEKEFGRSIDEAFGAKIEPLIAGGLLAREDNYLRLTRRGLLVADSVLEQFL